MMMAALLGIPVNDLRILSISMESNYVTPDLGGTQTTVAFDVGEPDYTDDGAARMLAITLGIKVHTTQGKGVKVFSADVRVGCSVQAIGDEDEDVLTKSALDTCIGYLRTIVMTLSSSSTADLRLSFPEVSASDILAAQTK